ncbi:MAPEG family protein [Sphingosinicella terrae]|uniref:MAPEG family protein n=1 Tax=Sphingosinicella terrae TaxID=2172047 RepID=UPI000E0DB164|nr:MAPEG family protein [Sphingosinicella terrae]
MPSTQIVAPVVALVAWTLVIMFWMFITRFPAMTRKRIFLKGMVGGRGHQLDGIVEDHVQWKSHNYNHLMEQPTLFYAICLALALIGGGDGRPELVLAWAYVAFRILHSLIQATVNVVLWRFLAFLAGSLCLVGLTLLAGLRLLGADG